MSDLGCSDKPNYNIIACSCYE